MQTSSKKAKLLYILPGFGESISDDGYSAITNYAKKQGYSVKPVQLKWKYRTATNWLKEFREVVGKYGEAAEVLGFSFGAYIAVLAAREFNFAKLHICSLSPYFKDDLPSLPKLAHTILKARRMKDFTKYDFPKKIGIETIFYVGDEDMPIVKKRVKDAFTTWTGKKKLVLVQGVGHTIEAPQYLSAIYKELKN